MQKSGFAVVLNKYKMVVVLIGLIIVCSIITPVFLMPDNLLNVARQISIIGIISVGMTFVVLTGGIDLSIGPTMAFATIFVALLSGLPGIVAVLAALGVGFLVGTLNGVIVTRFGVQPFIVTLGMMSVIKGIGLTISRGSPIMGTAPGISWIGRGKLFGILPIQALFLVAVAVIAVVVLKKTPLGRYTYAIGGNPEASMLSGISVKTYTTLVYSISGLLAGLAGILMATQLNIGEAKLGDSMEMDAIAAVVIGGTSLKGGSGSVGGTFIGILIIGILSNLLNLVNVSGYTQLIFKGGIIVGTAILQSVQEKK
ncbi:sugar ABC transporter permease [Bacteroidia bacterium]|nr:sugar ABC transporter permease [Bacteroidia bacterium]